MDIIRDGKKTHTHKETKKERERGLGLFPAIDSSESSDISIQSWIDWFCSLPGHEYYLAVPEEFIEDEFNLTGLSTVIPYYRQALEIILDCEDDVEEKVDPTIIEPYTFMLYGLIHQRYLLTANGIGVMAEKYSNGQFGRCPRYYCSQCFVLPVGRFDELGKESVCLYCPLCLDIYYPSSSIYQRVDGKKK
jgi:casein kinase II subunit beta